MTNKYNSDFNNNYMNSIGHLDIDAPQTAKGKKLFEWTFYVKSCDNTKQTKVTVIMFVIDGLITFKAECPLFVSAMTDTDVNMLRKNVETYLAEQASSLTGITWEDWFEVIVKGANSDFTDSNYSALGANLHIQVNKLKRGINPVNGNPVTININGIVVDFPNSTSIHDKKETLNEFRVKEEAERSYIPASAENLQALNEILSKMSLLRDKLSDFLSQELIQEKLQNGDSILRLDGPHEI